MNNCLTALLAGSGGGELVTATPTFSLVADHVRAIGGSVREVPLDAEMRHDLVAIFKFDTKLSVCKRFDHVAFDLD